MGLRKEPNFSYLLIGIMLFLLFGPVADQVFGDADGLMLMSVYSCLLIISLWSLQENKRIFWAGMALAITSILFVLADILYKGTLLNYAVMLVYLLFQLLSIWMATHHLVSADKVSLNTIIGATCVYFLIGMTWSIFYVTAVWLEPQSFLSSNLGDTSQLYWDMTYFSFVTLTTLGYGDIVPAGAMAKALAYTEAVIGQIFVAVLIGALVATYTGNKARDN